MIATNCFWNVHLQNKKYLNIARTQPSGFKFPTYPPLVPESWAVVDAAKRGDWSLYEAQLEKLDPAVVAREIDDCVLLCWERDPAACHRGVVGRWLKRNGYEVVIE